MDPWIIHGFSMDCPWIIHGLSMDYPWIIHGLSMDNPWLLHGLSMDSPWIIHGLSTDYLADLCPRIRFSPNSFPAIGVLAGLVERLVLGTGCRAASDPPFLLLFT